MRWNRASIQIVILILFSISFRSTVGADSGTKIVLLASGEWPPWTSAQLPHSGIAGRLVRDAFAAVGYRTEIVFFPWARAYAVAQQPPWVGTFPWIDMPERHAAYLYSDSIYESRAVFFHRRDFDFDWRDWKDLRGLRVGVTVGYAYGPEFAKAVRQGYVQLDTAPTDEANFLKLVHGRIDLFPVDELVGLMLLRQMKPEQAAQLTYHTRSVFVATNHLLISRNAPHAEDLLRAFNRGLRKIRAAEAAADARRRFLASAP